MDIGRRCRKTNFPRYDIYTDKMYVHVITVQLPLVFITQIKSSIDFFTAIVQSSESVEKTYVTELPKFTGKCYQSTSFSIEISFFTTNVLEAG